MSRFFSEKYADLVPYTPGEQPRGQRYIKLNTNENPYPPLPEVAEAVREESGKLYLYSDTDCTELRELLAKARQRGITMEILAECAGYSERTLRRRLKDPGSLPLEEYCRITRAAKEA